jgi:S1-C subfamily serine protease
MKIDDKIKKLINKTVVRIVAEDISINWNIPYLLNEPSKGQGTGFFINDNGDILTCAHVVSGARNVYIEIPSLGNDKYECTVIAICPVFDIAMIRCNKFKSKNYVKLGDSDSLIIGSEVMVVGYPASYTTSSSNTNNLKYTVGIIKGQQKGLIETDSAINPGNSGGPLFCNGKVIGINSMKLIGESLENIGYAIPINKYKVIKDQFEKNKIIYRPNLLFDFNNTDKDILRGLTSGKVSEGIIVSKILDESPLKKSPIKKDTIITKINNIKIDNYGYTYEHKWLGTNISIDVLLNNFTNDQTIKISYLNNNVEETCAVKLKPFVPPVRMMYPSFEDIPYLIIGGMVFMNLCINHILDKDFSTENFNIVCVTRSEEELLKKRLIISFIYPNTKVNILNNLKKNDFIEKVNDISVNSVDGLIKALKKPIIINKIEYIKIEADNGHSIIMSVEDVIKQDILFSEIYRYQLNPFHEKYLKNLKM